MLDSGNLFQLALATIVSIPERLSTFKELIDIFPQILCTIENILLDTFVATEDVDF